jgi:hypothetical protein
LRDALQHNASPEQIRKLTNELRAAMDKFLREFAQRQQQRRGEQSMRSPNGPQSITQQDLQAMLDRMQQMANAGDRDDAQKMLDQLQKTLENLQQANQQNQDPATQAMNQAMRDLDRLTHDQQKLRDQTQQLAHSQDLDHPDQQGGAQQPMTPQQLHDFQQALRKRLQDLEKQLQQFGQNQKGLKDAQKAMEEAEKSLNQGQQQQSPDQQGQDQQSQNQQNQGQQDQGQQGQGQQGQQGQGQQGQGDQGEGQQPGGQSPSDSAVASQGRALDGLRKGAEQLAKSMQQGRGQGQQPGSQQGPGQAEGAGDEDPLGRPMANDPTLNPNARLNLEGLPAAERAQRVLEELRRRLADPWRSQQELDYLERLLQPY